ncbi:hypothetical protein HGRIS_011264 [Hohenbuehelia grisea]|uniref:T6SS Phospholipase effector Tle1-like catalytic domain-containing protein n=1 Tax=Hohenbuehelia grisea TaxID=104357 RepID=A0ABR3JVX8_9AGAR
MLKKDDRDQQMVYYQAGIGTYTSPAIATPLAARFSKSLDEMVAWNLNSHVMDGYEFLMQNYKANDRISIFGFSRGAYTARALAGMLYKVGLLPACNHQQVPFAYHMYTSDDDAQARRFKETFSISVGIEFLGVWDTVSSVGLIPRSLPFANSNKVVKTFRHAIALDERRAKFKANHWTCAHGERHEAPAKKTKHTVSAKSEEQRKLEKLYAKDPEALTNVKEVWFAGCHCDVGGGSVGNDTPHSLARIPLRWMIRQCFKTYSGIMFESSGLKDLGLDPKTLWPKAVKRPAPAPNTLGLRIRTDDKKAVETSALMTEEEHDLHDVLSPIYDQLSIKPLMWSPLELFPFLPEVDPNDPHPTFTSRWPNLGNGRKITIGPDHKVRVHRSVKARLEALGADNSTRYTPKASLDEALKSGLVKWVK